MDVYHIEYGEVKDKVKIPVVKYKEDTAYRCCSVTVFQLPPPSNCPPVKTSPRLPTAAWALAVPTAVPSWCRSRS